MYTLEREVDIPTKCYEVFNHWRVASIEVVITCGCGPKVPNLEPNALGKLIVYLFPKLYQGLVVCTI